ncbi:hypothetical protein GNY06_01970 [Elizabethkingia argentiflava]|uniref:TonB-dependent receptor n=1 Tax=Elizabethkingia argenteiflava TaxID=2681556 RepID=A0A845PT30_9FLAO|nr:hypothetical protein [Elizabethkingia argenteiflava]NAW50203.1 hypothetical protein [Elizabethkingia argenteiflava]
MLQYRLCSFASLFYFQFFFAQEVKKDSISHSIDSVAIGEEKITPRHDITELVLVKKDPITEHQAVTKLEKLDIYFNPTSQADPLKAINTMPFSTNLQETALPVLRGGDANRSKVYLNGVPIFNPVRNSTDNNLGNFSLFNTELLEKEYVYPSNPPLSFGNSSAGIVEIETSKKITLDNLQISLSLSNIGLLLSKKLSKKEGDFFQIYTNYQFSKAFVDLNKNSDFLRVKNFSSRDLGLNAHVDLTDYLSFNSYTYFIDEDYTWLNSTLNYMGDASFVKKRLFSVNNLDFLRQKNKFRFSVLADVSNSTYKFGNILSNTQTVQYFSSLYHQHRFTKEFSMQYGLDFFLSHEHYDEFLPKFYYALNPQNLNYHLFQNKSFQYTETYLWVDYKTKEWGVSAAARQNLFPQDKVYYTSYQLMPYYHWNNKNKLNLGMGKYHSFSPPFYTDKHHYLLTSKQIGLDYQYENRKLSISSAIYTKEDNGTQISSIIEQAQRVRSFGIEFSAQYNFTKNLYLQLSNLFLDQKQSISGKEYPGTMDMKYFIKAQMTFLHAFINASLALTTRPGQFYTDIYSASYSPEAQNYQPLYTSFYNERYSKYFRLDFTTNKTFSLKKGSLISFLSISNLFNNKNQSSAYYNLDYSRKFFVPYQGRVFYFGVQWRWNNIGG